jgi:hypothetical protein
VSTGHVTPDQAHSYAVAVSAIPGVERVDAPDGRYANGVQVSPSDPSLARMASDGNARFDVVPKVEPISKSAEQLIARIRSVHTGFGTAVAGQSASMRSSPRSRWPACS